MKKHTQAILIDFNRTIFDPDRDKMYPKALDTLQYLAQSYDLYLISKVESNRTEKLKKLKIKDLFREVHFVEEKTEKLFEEILQVYDKKSSYVIGDVSVNEIAIGIKIETNTIWVRQGKFKNVELPPWHKKPTHIIKKIEEVRNIIVS